MSLFEIELGDNFLFKSKLPFLLEHDFNNFYARNIIHSDNEFKSLLYEDNFFEVEFDSIINCRFKDRRKEYECLKEIVSINIYEEYYEYREKHSKKELSEKLFGCNMDKVLYPIWQLFYIAIGKLKWSNYNQTEFIVNLEYFKKLSETIYKEYLIRNSYRDLEFENYEKAFEFKKELFQILKKYNKEIYILEKLTSFLKYLLQLHYLLRENEKYKLMWNLESTYILTTIMIMIRDFELTYTQIVELVKDETNMLHQTDINLVYKDINTSVKENHFYYANKSIIQFVNNMLNKNIEENKFIEVLTSNDRYKEILSSIIEINNRFFANKRDESNVVSITVDVILNTEIFIKEKSTSTKDALFEKLKGLDNSLCSHKLTRYRNLINQLDKGDVFFEKYNKFTNEKDSVEKVLILYYHSRNYVAHNLVDFEKFFYENNRKVINTILNSILTILYYLEEMDS